MRIIITGTPGTGKTIVSDKLGKKLKLEVLHVTDFVKQNNIGTKSKNEKEIDVDIYKLKKALLNKKGIIESHLLCEFNLKDSVVIVLRCDPKILIKRLSKRHYPQNKVRENTEAEAIDYCTQLAEKNYDQVFEVDTTKLSVQQTVDKCIKIIKGKYKGDKVDFSNYLID